MFELDTYTSHQCPNGLSQRTDGSLVCTCIRSTSAGGCSSVSLDTSNVNYSRVCGRITGYQLASIGVGSGGGGGQEVTPPPPQLYPLFTTSLQYCSIADVVPHLCPLTGKGNLIFVV